MVFFDDMTGADFLDFMAKYRKIKSNSRTKELLDRFELDARSKLKKMSKGMKQKVGIVAAFMHDLQLFIGSICFLCSCTFNDSKYAVGVGAGIPALEFIVQMMANAGKELENAKYATFFTLFDSDGIIAGESGAIWGMIVLFAGAIVLYSTAIVIFSKKDLHI